MSRSGDASLVVAVGLLALGLSMRIQATLSTVTAAFQPDAQAETKRILRAWIDAEDFPRLNSEAVLKDKDGRAVGAVTITG